MAENKLVIRMADFVNDDPLLSTLRESMEAIGLAIHRLRTHDETWDDGDLQREFVQPVCEAYDAAREAVRGRRAP